MRNLFLIIATALAIFVSCNKIDDMKSQANEIAFVNGLQTKANTGIVSGTEFTYDDFGVYGFVEDAANVEGGYLFKNAKYVKESDHKWIPDAGKHYYWPKADNKNDINVNFTAYTPHIASPTVSGANVTIPITANALNASCVDVLYATAQDIHPTETAVPLTFTHALAWIEFQGKFANPIDAVTITSIEFSTPLKSTADLVLNVEEATATVNNAGGSVSPNMANNIALSAQDDGTGTTAYEVLSDMLVVPQNVPAQVTITFDITITNESDGETIVYHGRTITRTINAGADANKQNNPATGRDFVGSWLGAKKYVYRVYVTVDEVIFDVNVDDWTIENPFQIWDHNATAYVEHFFDRASVQMGLHSAIA